MNNFDTGEITLTTGLHVFEGLAPERCSAAKIVIARIDQPLGPLFLWRVFERERDGVLLPLASGDEVGCVGYYRDGTSGAPLGITLRWPEDDDRDLIRLELDVLQEFRTSIQIEWEL